MHPSVLLYDPALNCAWEKYDAYLRLNCMKNVVVGVVHMLL